MTGAAKSVSSRDIVTGGDDADEDRMKRKRACGRAPAASAWERIALCIARTAEYQVGSNAASQEKKRAAWKPGVQTTLAPANRGAISVAIRPWMWNSGMM